MANKTIVDRWQKQPGANLLSKGAYKSHVVVQHSKLPDAKSSAKMKTYWGKALDRLRASLEK